MFDFFLPHIKKNLLVSGSAACPWLEQQQALLCSWGLCRSFSREGIPPLRTIMRSMRGFSRKNNGTSFQEEQSTAGNRSDNDPTDSSPASRSSSSRGGAGAGLAGGTARLSGREIDSESPPVGPSASSSVAGGAGGSGGTGSPTKAGSSNKKTLKIGRNVRFRGDVMECDTVLLCGRLQVRLFSCVFSYSLGVFSIGFCCQAAQAFGLAGRLCGLADGCWVGARLTRVWACE